MNEVDARLRQWGATEEEIARARAHHQIGVLAASVAVLPSGPRYTPEELATKVGMDRELAARFWRALGFADVADDERVFTEEDAEALSIVHALLQLGLASPEVAMQTARVLGSSLARIAEAMLGNGIGSDDPESAEMYALNADVSLATQAKLLEYVWRRHVQAAARRRLMAEPSDAPTVPLAVGFADLVGFTALSQQVSDHELANIVGRFEELAFDQVAAHGGRVAKMIGDEVMFVVDDVGAAAETALALAEAYADDEVLSDVRVGLAYGDVLAREGDYYGPVVNLASRMVNIAFPGSVVVSESVHAALVDDPRFAFHSLRPRNLKDIGRVRMWRARLA
ncbi:MAG: adenylate cyclase [Actinomycetota bacterium]|nr:adenylate cyclase [Actinomycetota bacterium]